jgi:hypothetical protein
VKTLILLPEVVKIKSELVYGVALDTLYGRNLLGGWNIIENDLDLFYLLVEPLFVGKLSI